MKNTSRDGELCPTSELLILVPDCMSSRVLLPHLEEVSHPERQSPRRRHVASVPTAFHWTPLPGTLPPSPALPILSGPHNHVTPKQFHLSLVCGFYCPHNALPSSDVVACSLLPVGLTAGEHGSWRPCDLLLVGLTAGEHGSERPGPHLGPVPGRTAARWSVYCEGLRVPGLRGECTLLT